MATAFSTGSAQQTYSTLRNNNMSRLLQLSFLVTLVVTFQGSLSDEGDTDLEFNPIRLFQGDSGDACLSWRFGVETNNIRHGVIRSGCEGYLKDYMTSYQYRLDSKFICKEALKYAKKLKVSDDGKDVWIFDIDETSLSNVPTIYSNSSKGKWKPGANVSEDAPALKETLNLYRRVKERRIKIVFLSGRSESQREITEANLQKRRYFTYEKLILRDPSYAKSTNAYYKQAERKKLVESGYRIVGNIGDQWSDIVGPYAGDRTFKLPNPMYHVE